MLLIKSNFTSNLVCRLAGRRSPRHTAVKVDTVQVTSYLVQAAASCEQLLEMQDIPVQQLLPSE